LAIFLRAFNIIYLFPRLDNLNILFCAEFLFWSSLLYLDVKVFPLFGILSAIILLNIFLRLLVCNSGPYSISWILRFGLLTLLQSS
jgi:hypothetical protein